MIKIKLAAIGIFALTLTAIASEKSNEVSTSEGDVVGVGYDGHTTEQQIVHTTHMYTHGTQSYSIGWSSAGAQYAVFYACKGKGQPVDAETAPGDYSYDECAELTYEGDAGNWLNSPDGRFFYIQNLDYMGSRIFEMIDIEKLDLVRNLKIPSAPMIDGMAVFGPDPAKGEAGFSNSGDTLLAIVPHANRTELLVYDRTTPSSWALRESLPMDKSFSGVFPLEKAHALLWTSAGSLRLYNIEHKKNLWFSSIPILVDNNVREDLGSKVVIASPNLRFVLLVSELGATLIATDSGEIIATQNASEPSMACTEKTSEGVSDSLPRSPGRCGQLSVGDDGTASITLRNGTTIQLAR